MFERSIFSFFEPSIERASQTTNNQLARMKVLLFCLAVLCASACIVQAQRYNPGRLQPPRSFPRGPSRRFRREEPQGSVVLQGTQPLSGPNRNPTVDLNYNHRLIDNGRTSLNAWGGARYQDRHVSPQVGLSFQHRFRREEPQGSIVLQGTQPLSGPNRNPTLDLNYNHRLIDNGRSTLDAFGGASYQNRHVSPQAGLSYEHRFNNNMFIRGQGQVQPGPGGRLDPSFGANLGWRFRREATPYEEEEGAEEVY